MPVTSCGFRCEPNQVSAKGAYILVCLCALEPKEASCWLNLSHLCLQKRSVPRRCQMPSQRSEVSCSVLPHEGAGGGPPCATPILPLAWTQRTRELAELPVCRGLFSISRMVRGQCYREADQPSCFLSTSSPMQVAEVVSAGPCLACSLVSLPLWPWGES